MSLHVFTCLYISLPCARNCSGKQKYRGIDCTTYPGPACVLCSWGSWLKGHNNIVQYWYWRGVRRSHSTIRLYSFKWQPATLRWSVAAAVVALSSRHWQSCLPCVNSPRFPRFVTALIGLNKFWLSKSSKSQTLLCTLCLPPEERTRSPKPQIESPRSPWCVSFQNDRDLVKVRGSRPIGHLVANSACKVACSLEVVHDKYIALSCFVFLSPPWLRNCQGDSWPFAKAHAHGKIVAKDVQHECMNLSTDSRPTRPWPTMLEFTRPELRASTMACHSTAFQVENAHIFCSTCKCPKYQPFFTSYVHEWLWTCVYWLTGLIDPSIHPSTHRSIDPSLHRSIVCLFCLVCLFVCLFVCLLADWWFPSFPSFPSFPYPPSPFFPCLPISFLFGLFFRLYDSIHARPLYIVNFIQCIAWPTLLCIILSYYYTQHLTK